VAQKLQASQTIASTGCRDISLLFAKPIPASIFACA
jgi:hypothetical protein